MARRTKHLKSTRESSSRHRTLSNRENRYKVACRRADGQRFDNFDITHWIDYVRGVVTDSNRKAMKRHLAEGRNSCAHLVALVKRVRQASVDERTVPQALVDSAKAVFQERRSFAQVTDLRSMTLQPVDRCAREAIGKNEGSREISK